MKGNLSTSRFSFARLEELAMKLGIASKLSHRLTCLMISLIKLPLLLMLIFIKNEKLIGCHPNNNTATVILEIKDLLQIIKQNGNPVKVVQL